MNNNYEKDGQMIYSNDIQVENIELIGNRKEKNSIEENFSDIVDIADEKQTNLDNYLE